MTVGPSQAAILRCVQIQWFLVAPLTVAVGKRRVSETLVYQPCCVCYQTLGEKTENRVSQLHGSVRDVINKVAHNLLN